MSFAATLVWCVAAISVVTTHALSFRDATCLDCYTLQFNTSYPNPQNIINCSKSDLPYCDENTASCSAVPSPSCVPADNFTCLSDGYFPDPWDCRSFHLCVDLKPTRYQCDPSLPSSYKYDVVLHRCSPSAVCGFNCDGKSGVKVPHPTDGNLFAFCYNGTVLLQDRCPANYELQETSQRCEAECKTQGVIVDLDDCRMFFRCVRQGGGYWRKHEQCPDGFVFNPLTFRCEEDISDLSTTTSRTSTTTYILSSTIALTTNNSSAKTTAITLSPITAKTTETIVTTSRNPPTVPTEYTTSNLPTAIPSTRLGSTTIIPITTTKPITTADLTTTTSTTSGQTKSSKSSKIPKKRSTKKPFTTPAIQQLLRQNPDKLNLLSQAKYLHKDQQQSYLHHLL